MWTDQSAAAGDVLERESLDNRSMNRDSQPIDADAAWRAVTARDRNMDGRFVTGVLTTGIYCRPSCAARHPKRENVRFFATGAEAAEAGLRPCLRCKPDEMSREAAALDKAFALLDGAEAPPSLEVLASAAGYSPHHFHRLFKRATGVTPAEYARGRRARSMTRSLQTEARVTDAIYVRERARAPASFEDSLPPVFAGRTLSLRGFDPSGMLRRAVLALPGEAEARIGALFAQTEIATIHAHNAAHGCFVARVERNRDVD